LTVIGVYDVRLTATALAEIQDICAYIGKDNPTAAASVLAAIQRTIASIAKRPNLAPIVHDGRVRAKLVERFQYRIFYEFEERVVVVRNVRSTRRLRPLGELILKDRPSPRPPRGWQEWPAVL
jgi:plasmid stabilization system protein ParE